jgi:hypothetical protein
MSLPWIKIATAITTDAKVVAIAKRCRVHDAEALGLIVSVLVSLPQLAPNGDVSEVSDATLERVAMWEGKRGVFAAHFRDVWCDAGVVVSWEKWNGAVMREASKRAPRAKQWRDERNAARMHSERDANAFGTRLESGKKEKEIEKNYVPAQLGEVDTSPPPPAVQDAMQKAREWVAPNGHAALAALLSSVDNPTFWVGILNGYASGTAMDGYRPCGPERLAVALEDFVATGKHQEPGGPSANLLRGYIKRAKAPVIRHASQLTEAEDKAETLREIRVQNERRRRMQQPERPLPSWAAQIDAMFPDGRTWPTGAAA